MSDIRIQKYVSITSGAIAGGGVYVPYTPDEGGVQLINGLLVMGNRPLTLDNRVMRLSNAN
jgi:hypothetical protein